jgi:hypothetical protein
MLGNFFRRTGKSIISLGFAKGLAMLLFGVIVPVVIAINSSAEISSARQSIEQASKQSYIMEVFREHPDKLKYGNDYALVALADSERANLAIMVNKQVMKLLVIYMGFAVMSFAMMFIVLGFTEGPVTVAGTTPALNLNMSFGSIGAAVFVLGAVMAAGGGLLRSDYKTVGLPGFIALTKGGAPADEDPTWKALESCKALAAEAHLDCAEATIQGLRAEKKGERK